MTKSSCSALSTVCRFSTMILPANCKAGFVGAVMHLGLAAQASAAQSHRSVLRDVGLRRRQIDAGELQRSSRPTADCGVTSPFAVSVARLVDAGIEAHFHRLGEIEAHPFDLQATAARARLSPPAAVPRSSAEMWPRAPRSRADRIARRRRSGWASARRRGRHRGHRAATASAGAACDLGAAGPAGGAASFIRLIVPSGSRHASTLTPDKDTESTCAWRFARSTAAPLTINAGMSIQSVSESRGLTARSVRDRFATSSERSTASRSANLYVAVRLDAARVDHEIEPIGEILPDRVRAQSIDVTARRPIRSGRSTGVRATRSARRAWMSR